ncbi:hypothetical protein CI109_102072 [Kwoniella shandongensis]|uniref:Uncharacterized protein n=1 Tax=Kwoniella shandongensis TaxID=1734106 RepID=A0A5M6BVY9_9TREE|nr:uncharacterized protein CI109_006519 [Kwoniella shandongensis]KAA5525149.1 hypothetical protein CI109_006519 [Kwoniella shandongensis]
MEWCQIPAPKLDSEDLPACTPPTPTPTATTTAERRSSAPCDHAEYIQEVIGERPMLWTSGRGENNSHSQQRESSHPSTQGDPMTRNSSMKSGTTRPAKPSTAQSTHRGDGTERETKGEDKKVGPSVKEMVVWGLLVTALEDKY